jgi:hypothetical protein
MSRDVEPTNSTQGTARAEPVPVKAAAPDRRRLLIGGLVAGTTLTTLASRPAMASSACGTGMHSVSSTSLNAGHKSCAPITH